MDLPDDLQSPGALVEGGLDVVAHPGQAERLQQFARTVHDGRRSARFALGVVVAAVTLGGDDCC